jgi:hypothetical protein
MAIKQKYGIYVATVLAEGFSAVADFNTDAIDWRKFNGEWIFVATRSLATGSPRITIQSSEDGTNWVNYGTLSTSMTIPSKFEDLIYRPNYIRFVYTISGAPTGTITILLYQVI